MDMASRKYSLCLLTGLLLVLSACFPQSTPQPQPSTCPNTPTYSPSTGQFDGSLARQYLQALSQTIGPRSPGTPAEAQAAQYVRTTLEGMGYTVQVQPFSFTPAWKSTGDMKTTLSSANVMAVKTGSSSREIIVGAHYDSGDEGRGADDNASGVAVLLETAREIRNLPTPCTIRFIAFGAEEDDLDGSRYYTDHMSNAEVQNTVAMINLDSLAAGDIAYVYGNAGDQSLRSWIMTLATQANIHLETRTAAQLDGTDGTPCECSDYSPFQSLGIPFAYFEATDWNIVNGNSDDIGMIQVNPIYGDDGEIWHTQYDTVQYIDSTFPGRIDQHLHLFVTLLANTLTQITACP
jgi:alkaline phosphatase isozyme conversion protein